MKVLFQNYIGQQMSHLNCLRERGTLEGYIYIYKKMPTHIDDNLRLLNFQGSRSAIMYIFKKFVKRNFNYVCFLHSTFWILQLDRNMIPLCKFQKKNIFTPRILHLNNLSFMCENIKTFSCRDPCVLETIFWRYTTTEWKMEQTRSIKNEAVTI